MIKVENLKKRYDDFCLDLSFELPKGRVSGLVGRNGAGKSTTLKSILGLVKADEGSVRIFGRDVKDLSVEDKQRLGIAMSESAFSAYLNIEAIAKILKQMYPRFEEERFFELCKKMSLPVRKQIKEFSTGMKARLKVIIALSHRADLLLLDEPTAGLDVEARNEILDILRDYLAENEEASLLISSHISSDLEGLCDDIYLINDGKILLHEATDELLDKYGVIKADEALFERLDKEHILAYRKEKYGYALFTDAKDYYKENYPEAVIENGSIDDLILIMGKRREG